MKLDDHQIEQIVCAIKNDTRSGATELTRDALNHILSYGGSLHTLSAHQSYTNLHRLVKRLMILRPSMALLQHTLEKWLTQVDTLDVSSNRTFITQVKALCRQLIEDIDTRQRNQIRHAIKLLATTQVILSISRSSVLSEVFTTLPQRPLRIIVCESRPGCEGRILAEELASAEILVDYIVDAASGLYISQADAVVVGADAILADGSVVNKCGTSLLALAAQHFKVPFYVVVDSSKCTGLSRTQFILEEMPLAEINAPISPFIHPHNIYFDISPPDTVTAYITECGIEEKWPWSNIMRRQI